MFEGGETVGGDGAEDGEGEGGGGGGWSGRQGRVGWYGLVRGGLEEVVETKGAVAELFRTRVRVSRWRIE